MQRSIATFTTTPMHQKIFHRSYCGNCRSWVVKCPTCGNNSCNGGRGKLPNVEQRIKEAVADGWTIAIASNQGGREAINPETGKPYHTFDWAFEEMRYTMTLLPDVTIALFAPSFESDGLGRVVECKRTGDGISFNLCASEFIRFRKPEIGMLKMAWECAAGYPTNRSDWKEIVYVGDDRVDAEAAKKARVCFRWADDWREKGIVL